MKTMELNRRQFLKTTGALVVSFNLFPPTLGSLRTIISGCERRTRSHSA